MTTTAQVPTLPTKVDYKEAEDAVYKASEALDYLQHSIALVDEYDDARAYSDPMVQVSVVDVGELFGFIEAADLYLDESRAKLDAIRELLRSLNLTRLECEGSG